MRNSIKKVLVRISTVFVIAIAIPAMLFAETVGVFFDSNVSQIKFAAGDVKTALELKGFTVEMLPLAQLSSSYSNKKVVIAIFSDAAVTGVLTNQGGASPTRLGEQAYSLITTSQGQLSYWVFGGDNNGAMYGGLQIAENIQLSQFAGSYNSQESPSILKRGIKLNLPWDKRSGTYGKGDGATFEGTSAQLAIKDVWDMTFWTTWFDEMARNRYNTLSLWSCHPFTSLISLPGYEDCAIQNVTYYDGTVKIMTIAQKITFWQQVMAYAHDRGFEFYLFNWNIFTEGATNKYGITSSATNASTVTYMYKSMVKLLETYPDLDGFGITNGEKGSTEDFLWNTYGKGMRDYAIANPQRKFRLIHRFHWTTFEEITSLFGSLIALPNVKLDVSFKWSAAHMYSSPVPNNFKSSDKDAIKLNNLKTWLTVRNDDMYYLNWGNPDFAREYVNGMLTLGDIYEGFYMGCDGYNPTRTFFSKNNVTQGMLEVQRQEYMMKLWGRLSYNPNTTDEVFKNYMAVKYPTVTTDNLFNAWRSSSKGIQLATELIQGTYSLDFHWYPEDCGSGRSTGFRTIADFGGANVASGSKLCNISKSASGTCGSAKNSYQLADFIETSSNEALSLIGSMSASNNTELGVTLNNIRALSFLGLYYAEKIRGATYLKANNSTAARDAMGRAYCKWMNYVNIMDAMFTGMDNQRVDNFANWHAFDANVLKEYTDLGGIGVPNCTNSPQAPYAYFTADYTSIAPGETVNFTDKSSNTPTSWRWSFEGGYPATSTDQNPSVSYSKLGNYRVTLVATNAVGADTLTKAGFITVTNNTSVGTLTDWISGTTNNKVNGKNRLMTVLVMGESTGDFSANGVTYGGQPMTKQVEKMQTDVSRSYTAIFTLNEAGVNAASSGTIAVTWSATPSESFSIYSVLLRNVDQTTPVIASATNGLTGSTLTTVPLAAASGDMVIMCGATAKDNSVTFNNGFFKQFESNSSWGDGIGGSKIGNGVNETPSFTQSASGRMALCAIVVKNASASTSKVENDLDKGINIYPNPASKILNISLPNDKKNRGVKIFNAMGQMVYATQTKDSKLDLNIKSLNLKGIFMVQIKSDNEISNYKVILQ